MASRKVADKAKVHELADTASDSATKVIGRVEQALTKLDLGRVDVQQITNDILNGKVDLSGFAKDLNLGTVPPTEELGTVWTELESHLQQVLQGAMRSGDGSLNG
ncbi:unnamed protein product [Symbiodinium sp. CCMP2456]|nr:unnamed protein product [Symbiodinium sp. CCMP2456]